MSPRLQHPHHSEQAQQHALIALLTSICQVPAPTFAEQARAAFIAQLWQEYGLSPQRDETGNVVVDLPGGQGPRVLLAAHLDTVFSADTDVHVRSEGRYLCAPGIGDNSASLAVLSYYLQGLEQQRQPRPRLSIAATVGEEGLGDLYGMRALMEARAEDFDMVIAVDGHLGIVVNASVGSRRHHISIDAPGGHSWGDYPSPSAVHALGDMVHALGEMHIPNDPRSSYNVGEIGGGTSINAIAQQAHFNLDLRSLDEDVLQQLEHNALRAIARVAEAHGVRYESKQVGRRPAAKVDNQLLVRAAQASLRSLQLPARLTASSTDANAAMAAGLPAIAFGVYQGGDAHRLSEWLEPTSLLSGYQALVSLLAQLSR